MAFKSGRKRIGIISTGYMWFPCESGTVRMYDIACAFAENGYEVETIVTDFQHYKKAPRDKELILSQGYPFNIIFAHAPAYTGNISLKRIKSNKTACANIISILKERIRDLDLVLVSIPPNNTAADVTELCRDNDVPCIVDVEDLWPEAMEMVIKNRLARLFLKGFTRDAERAYASCSAVTGTSSDYTARAFKNNKRNIPAITVHVGCEIQAFDTFVKEHEGEVNKPAGEFWLTYAGSVSTSYDIETLIYAGEMLFTGDGKGKYTDIKIHILGTGTKLDALSEYVRKKGLENIIFHGFVAYPVMAAYLKASDALLNSFVKGAPQSIVNKVGDYFAAGKPVINTLESDVFCRIIEENEAGINIKPQDPGALFNAIIEMYSHKDKRERYGKNARKLCEAQFDRKEGNRRIIELADSLIEGNTAKSEKNGDDAT